MQSALNCTGKCDCCDKLQQQINAIKTQLARLKNVDENALKTSLKASLQPDIFTAVAAAGVVATNKLQPQIEAIRKTATDAFLEVVENTKKQRLLEIEARGASEVATRVEKNAAEYARQMREAQAKVTQIEGEQARLNRTNKALEVSDIELRELSARNAREAERLAQIERKNSSKLGSLEQEIPSIKNTLKGVASDAELAKGLSNQAISKSSQAITESVSATTKTATVARDAFNLSTEVSGLRGLVNGFGSKVNALGKAIGTLETAVGNAVTAAAKAVGISSEALAATGRLAGRLLEAFNAIATIFTLIEQLATLNILGGRIDAVESGLQALGNDVSRILGKLLGLQNRIGANESLTAQVKNIALDAKGIGEAAKLQAGAAQVTATRAENFGQIANANAKTAQTTADGAVRNATRANDNAMTAYQKAADAQLTANKAQSTAANAEGIGNQAKKIAGEALGKAGQALGVGLTAIALFQTVRFLRGLPGLPGRDGRNGATELMVEMGCRERRELPRLFKSLGHPVEMDYPVGMADQGLMA
ncbi:hypothetical protein CDG76_20800 [Nostoc sp. 'Peltigera membranacea cyanobiont' 210A]|nr:hypothetical protein CDG76_20800 [Nostoc sp. 'Peltigera membranacea cyanobiont' 210A]